MYEIKTIVNFDYYATIEKIAKLEFKLNHVRLSKSEIQETISDITNYREQCVTYLLFHFEQSMSKCIQDLEIDIFEYTYNHKMR